jgi:hypothetical protein
VPDHQRDCVAFAGVVRDLATPHKPLAADFERLQPVHGGHLYHKLAMPIHDIVVVLQDRAISPLPRVRIGG